METVEHDGWEIYAIHGGLHIVPNGDWAKHELHTMCQCKPVKQVLDGDDVWSHKPFDKRTKQTQIH